MKLGGWKNMQHGHRILGDLAKVHGLTMLFEHKGASKNCMII